MMRKNHLLLEIYLKKTKNIIFWCFFSFFWNNVDIRLVSGKVALKIVQIRCGVSSVKEKYLASHQSVFETLKNITRESLQFY